MPGKILIVDPIATNRIVLKVKLSSAYYDVLQASNAVQAFGMAQQHTPDLIISSVSLPDGSITDLLRLVKSNSATKSVPLLAISSCESRSTRLSVLEAGVQDIVSGISDDALLLGRVRNLIRAHTQVSEWRIREHAQEASGFAEPKSTFNAATRTVIVTEDYRQAQGWLRQLRPLLADKVSVSNPSDFLGTADAGGQCCFVLLLPKNAPGPIFQLLSAFRAHAHTQNMGILVLQVEPDPDLGATALDLGADELMSEGFDADEMVVRIKSMMRRKQEREALRASVRTGLDAAIFDPLTGLHNRRFAIPQLNNIAAHAAKTGRPFAVMIADLDHFKRVNDVYGHQTGDAVLTEAATRLRKCLRPADMIARIGGEEFLIMMPGVPLPDARQMASRLCNAISRESFRVPGQFQDIDVTISIGLTLGGGTITSTPCGADQLMDTADKALYAAKMHGRNQVTLSRPAA